LGGKNISTTSNSVEIFNPKTNTWKLIEHFKEDDMQLYAGVVIDKPPHFITI